MLIHKRLITLFLVIYNITIANFLFLNSERNTVFFEDTFLLNDTNMEVVLEMSFLIFINTDINFKAKKFTWKPYTIVKVLFTIK